MEASDRCERRGVVRCAPPSCDGWNVLLTSRNAKGPDLLIYDRSGRRRHTVQVKTLTKPAGASLGKWFDGAVADFYVVLTRILQKPQAFILTSKEVDAWYSKIGHRPLHQGGMWLGKQEYQKHPERWDKIGHGDFVQGATRGPQGSTRKRFRLRHGARPWSGSPQFPGAIAERIRETRRVPTFRTGTDTYISANPTWQSVTRQAPVERFRAVLRQHLPALAERYGVRRLSLFGSYVRGEEQPWSDLDILVEFTRPPTLFEFVRLEQELQALLGVKVDLVMREGLKPRIGDAVLREAVPV